MGTIEKQMLEKERNRWKNEIRVEQEAIAAGDLLLSDQSLEEPEHRSRRERLLELQAKLSTVESKLMSEDYPI